MDQLNYKKIISNDCLNEKVELQGSSPVEIRVKEKVQLNRWKMLEKVAKEREDIEDLKELAEFDTFEAQVFVEQSRGLLLANLDAGSKLDWTALYDDEPYPPFVFEEPAPRYEPIAREMGVPKKSFLELFVPSTKTNRLSAEHEARQTLEEKQKQYQENMEKARTAHEERRRVYLEEQRAYNDCVDQLQKDFEKGLPYAVESFVRMNLARLSLPGRLKLGFDAYYDRSERLVVINCLFPCPGEVPAALRFNFNEEDHSSEPVEMSREEFEQFYLDIFLQTALSSLFRVFESVSGRHIQRAGFNGLVPNPDPENDQEAEICIMSLLAGREAFLALDLAATPPQKCFALLKGVMNEPLTGLNQVRPVINIERSTREENQALPATGNKPEAYRPGDLRRVAQSLVTDLIDQIEDTLSEKTRPNKSDLH